MTWWGWMILGVLILGAELFAIDAQFYLVFIGISAAVVGLSQLLGMQMPEWAQWAAFAALSLFSMFSFRKNLYERLHGASPDLATTPEGETIMIESALDPGQEDRIEFRGSDWTVRNVGATAIEKGTRVHIVGMDGLKLHVSNDSGDGAS